MALALTMVTSVHDNMKEASTKQESFESAHIDHVGTIDYVNYHVTSIYVW